MELLACNFSNSSLWKQCPLAEIQNSPFITRNEALQTFDLEFTVPTDFDSPRRYIVMVTAIDKSGNAMVASTPEINADWEVLAGRTYSGIGGSGSTLQRRGEHPYLAVDKHGQLFVTSENFKINAFDLRTCTIFRKDEKNPTPTDCADVIDLQGFSVNPYWVYAPDRDVFFAKATRDETTGSVPYVVSIDFNRRKITPLIGGVGKPFPNSSTKDAEASNLSAGTFGYYLYYEKTSKKLYLKTDTQIFSMNHNQLVSFEFGGTAQVSNPTDQTALGATALSIPSGNWAFIATEDQRFLLWGNKRPEHPSGSIYSIQYLVEKLSPEQSSASSLYSLKVLSRNGDDLSMSYAIQPVYDPEAKTLYSNSAWNGFSKMSLPPRLSGANDYQWMPLMKHTPSEAINPILDADHENSEVAIPQNALPRKVNHHSFGLARANSTTLIMSEWLNGMVFGYDLKTNRLFRLVGFPVGQECEQLAINRRLDTPRWLFVDNNGDTVVSDYHNVQKVVTSGIPNYLVKTLSGTKLYAKSPLFYNSSRNEIAQLAISDGQNAFRVFSASNLATPIFEKLNAVADLQYHLATAFSNDFTNPRITLRGAYWVHSGVGKAYMREFQKVGATKQLTVADQLPLGHADCGGSECQQAAPLATNLYRLSDFRLSNLAGNPVWRDPIGSWAYTAGDSYVVGCLQGRYVRIDKTGNELIFFDVRDGVGTNLPCSERKTHFSQFNGVMHVSVSNRFYSIDLSSVATTHLAVATLLSNVGDGAPGDYGAIFVNNDGVYYTEMISGRVLRNKRK